MFEVGDTTVLSTSITDSTGAAVNISGLTVTVKLPDGTSSGPLTPTNTSTGHYSYSYTVTQAGRHLVTWAGTGYVDTAVFNAAPTDPGMLFPLEDARNAIGNVPTTKDEELRSTVAAVTPIIEDIVGPLVVRTFTDVAYGRADASGRATIALNNVPVVAVTSVTPRKTGMVSPDLTGLLIDSDAGLLELSNWQPFYGPLTVVYTAGRTVIPPNVLLAAVEQLRFLWQLGRQGNRPAFGQAPDSTDWTPSGFAVPHRVIELCGPHRQPPGIA